LSTVGSDDLTPKYLSSKLSKAVAAAAALFAADTAFAATVVSAFPILVALAAASAAFVVAIPA
jgi:hypothetical protein